MRSRVVRKALSALLLLASIGWLIDYVVSQPGEFRQLLSLRPSGLWLLLALQVTSALLHAQGLRIVMRKCCERAIAFAPWLRLFVYARVLNAVLPQLGSAYRGLRLKELFGTSWTGYVAGLLAFSWMSTAFNLLLGALVIAAFDRGLGIFGVPAAGLLMAAFALVAAGPPLALLAMPRGRKHRALDRVLERTQEALSLVVRGMSDRSYVLRVCAFATAAALHGCLMQAAVFWSLGLRVGLAEIVLFFVLLRLSSVIVITPGNLGVREIMFGLLGASVGIGLAEGLAASALLRAANYAAMAGLAAALGGWPALRRARLPRVRPAGRSPSGVRPGRSREARG